MKKFIGIVTTILIASSSFMAWGYSSSYGNYSYMGNWQYPTSYTEGCYRNPVVKTLSARTRMPATARPLRPKAGQSYKTLEQKYANLVVMFTKDPCPFCVFMKPIMRKAEMKFGKDIKFLYVDIDQNPQYPAQYEFSTVPHIAYFKDGKMLGSHGSGNRTMTAGKVAEKIKTFFRDVLSNH